MICENLSQKIVGRRLLLGLSTLDILHHFVDPSQRVQLLRVDSLVLLRAVDELREARVFGAAGVEVLLEGLVFMLQIIIHILLQLQQLQILFILLNLKLLIKLVLLQALLALEVLAFLDFRLLILLL